MPPFFIPSAAGGYSTQQLMLMQSMPYLRMQWLVSLSEMGTSLATNVQIDIPASVQGISAIMVGPNSDIDRFWFLHSKESPPQVVISRTNEEAVPQPLEPPGSKPGSMLFSVGAPFAGQLHRRDATSTWRITPARECTNAFFTVPSPFKTYASGLMIDIIAFLSDVPKFQPTRPPRTLSFSAGAGSPVSSLFKLAAMPVFGRRRKTVILTNPSGSPINYEIDGAVFSNSPATTNTELIVPLSTGSISAGATIVVPLNDPSVDCLQVLIDLDGATAGIGGQILVED